MLKFKAELVGDEKKQSDWLPAAVRVFYTEHKDGPLALQHTFESVSILAKIKLVRSALQKYWPRCIWHVCHPLTEKYLLNHQA